MAEPHPESCGCCAGRHTEAPAGLYNPPAQPAIGYRIGRHGTFKETLLARLSAVDMAALAALITRDDDDFSVALCDAAATMLDVMTFYQERIANENYLRTATESASVRELARLLGYQPAPGVAANVDLAFTLDEAPGAPELAALPLVLPLGTRAQSVPGPGETPQTYETVEAVEMRPTWNAMPVWAQDVQRTPFGLTQLYLAGTANQLVPGDVLLVVGTERESFVQSEQWDVRVLSHVEVDVERNVTRVEWKEGLGSHSPQVMPAQKGVRVYVFRQRAALFGHNAPNPNLLSSNGTNLDQLAPVSGGVRSWKNYALRDNQIDLDASYPRIAPGSWFALVNPTIKNAGASLAGYVELYRATSVSDRTRADFGLSSKVTRLSPDTSEHLYLYGLRDTSVLAQSEELTLAALPLGYPLYGTELALARVEADLLPRRKLAVRGKPARVEVARGAPAPTLTHEDGKTLALGWGDSLQVLAAPEELAADASHVVVAPPDLPSRMAAATLLWRVRDRDGAEGRLSAPPGSLRLRAARKEDKEITEVVVVAAGAAAVVHNRERTVFQLSVPLRNVYDRYSASVSANVAGATQGESVGEILGNGDAARPNQRFALKQAPLTFVSATTATGTESTLDVRVNGVSWEELPTLYQAERSRRAYALERSEDGRATVVFGDGIEGARVPTGAANVRATYRKGIGAAGSVPAARIKTLLTRPLGVNNVTNPEAAYGGQDPEALDQMRARAPLSVLTLGRVVSVQDYADFARTFAGIAKAHAVRLALGPGRGMFVTVAGPDGAAVPEDGKTFENLIAALRQYGDPMIALQVHSYAAAALRVKASVKVAGGHRTEDVLAAVTAQLLQRFGFAARDFGEPVSQDEVVAAVHAAAGVVAVSLSAFCRAGGSTVETIVWPRLPRASLTQAPAAAELLTLAPSAIELGAMA